MMFEKFFKKIWILMALFLVVFTFEGIFFNPGEKLLDSSLNKSDEILIKLKTSTKIYKIKTKDFSLRVLLELLKARPEVEMAEPNYSLKISAAFSSPNDSDYDKLWYLRQIKAEEAWGISGGGKKEIVVAVLDTGVDIDHPDLKDNIWVNVDEISSNGNDDDHNGYIDDINGWDFLESIPDPRPKIKENSTEAGIQHGTLISGIIAAEGNNGQGVIGLSYEARIMPLRVLNNDGTGNVNQVIQGINYAIYNGAKIINLSFVGSEKSYFLKEALKKAWDMGLIVVAAAGNETANSPLDLNKAPTYPICLDAEEKENFIIGVAATDSQDKKASFSDYGASCIDISSPGTKFYGPLVYQPEKGFNNYYGGYWSGTSLSAPLVSSLAALVWSTNPLLSQKNVRDIILEQADEIDSLNPDFQGQLGKGRINAFKAVNYTFTQTGNLSAENYIVTGAGPGGGPHVRVFDLQGNSKSGFFAYDSRFKGGVTVSAGDVDGDGEEEIVTGAGPGGGPHVRVFDRWGNPKSGFFAYDSRFKGGVNVAVGDIDGDGIAEIVTGAGPGGGPHVRVFDFQGNPKAGFFAYDSRFLGGITITTGDLDGNGVDEIIVGTGPGGGPHVKVFDRQGNLKLQFYAYNETYYGGINLFSGADIDGDNKDDIIVAVNKTASPYIRVFEGRSAVLRLQFLPYDRVFYQGVKVSAADLNGNQKNEIVVGLGAGREPYVRIYDTQGNFLTKFLAYAPLFKGGVNVAAIKIK